MNRDTKTPGTEIPCPVERVWRFPFKRVFPSPAARLAGIPGYWLVHGLYRIRVIGREHLPESGGVLLIGNHVSYADVFVLQVAVPRPLRFVGAWWLFEKWWVRWFVRLYRVISISPRRPREALRRTAGCLRDGEVVCLFPEGRITRDGRIQELKPGFLAIAEEAKVPVVPFHLGGLWGSVLSYSGGRVGSKIPSTLRRKVTLTLGKPLTPEEMTVEAARRRVLELGQAAEQEDPHG